jgi:hypothetical protein
MPIILAFIADKRSRNSLLVTATMIDGCLFMPLAAKVPALMISLIVSFGSISGLYLRMLRRVSILAIVSFAEFDIKIPLSIMKIYYK